MEQQQALLRAVCAEPDDDGPRLVYADWLEENGQPQRAEFIRVQTELARLPARSQRRARLQAREQELLAKHKDQWLAPLKRFTDKRYAKYSRKEPFEFRRGFVEYMLLNSMTFMEDV